jgi:hypothetical protein
LNLKLTRVKKAGSWRDNVDVEQSAPQD